MNVLPEIPTTPQQALAGHTLCENVIHCYCGRPAASQGADERSDC